jgi:hypothetical protein
VHPASASEISRFSRIKSIYHQNNSELHSRSTVDRDMAFCCSSFKDGPELPKGSSGSSPDRWKVLAFDGSPVREGRWERGSAPGFVVHGSLQVAPLWHARRRTHSVPC